jgi:hypothetical protein
MSSAWNRASSSSADASIVGGLAMAAQLSPDSRLVLRQYADGQISIRELAEWLVQAEYDLDMPEEERDILAGIRLTLIEVSEGLRPKDDILENVAAALALSTPNATVVTVRSGSATKWDGEPTFTAAPSGVQRVGI